MTTNNELEVVRKLKVKIKMPNQPMMIMSYNNEVEHGDDEECFTCSLCDKVFNSRKALGGHMRIHSKRSHELIKTTAGLTTDVAGGGGACSSDIMEEDHEKVEEKSASCPICEKDFPSDKALFGHMRCHPERSWRGIQPPDQLVNYNNSSASSTLSDDVNIHDNGKIKEENEDVVNKGPLGFGWGAKAIRGRYATKSSGAEPAAMKQDVAESLLLLSRTGGVEYSDQLNEKKKYDEELGACDKKRNNSHVLTADEDREVMTNKKFKLISTNLDQEVRKHCIVSDFKEDLSDHSNVLPHSSPVTKKLAVMEIVSDNKKDRYKCTTCNKCFSSHQALGGHKSSHNKSRSTSTAPTRSVFNDNVLHLGLPETRGQSDGDHLGLSTKAASTKVHQIHQCNVCFKIYPSGQALGGHMRLHCSLSSVTSKSTPHVLLTPAPQPTSVVIPEPAADEKSLVTPAPSPAPSPAPIDHQDASTADKNGGCVFDLNELPPMEDELQAPVVHPAEQVSQQEAASPKSDFVDSTSAELAHLS